MDVRTKNILARTRKTNEASYEENSNPNIDKKELLKSMEQQALQEIEVLNKMIEQAGGTRKGVKVRFKHSVIEEYEEEEEEDE